MAAPVLTPLSFDADDEPYGNGLGYQEKMQQMADNQQLVAGYLATIEAAMEVGQSGYVPQGSWDASGDTYPVPVANGSWIISVPGVLGGESVLIGDIIVYAGSEWINIKVGAAEMTLFDDKSPQLSETLDSNGKSIENIGGVTNTTTDKGSVGTGTVTFNVSTTAKQKLTVTGDLTIDFSGWPASGKYAECEVELVDADTNVTFTDTINWVIGDGTTSTTFADTGITLAASGTNTLVVWSTDNGSTLYGVVA